MPDAYIYDHVRTPRGRGKPDGALHEVTALRLAETALRAIRERNNLDTKMVDDVVLGCVDPVGEAGGGTPRAAGAGAAHGGPLPGGGEHPPPRPRPPPAALPAPPGLAGRPGQPAR